MIERDRGELYSRQLASQMADLTDKIADTYADGPVPGLDPILDAFDLATLEIKLADDFRGLFFDENGDDYGQMRMKQWQTALVFAYQDSWDFLHELLKNKAQVYLDAHIKGDDWDRVGRAFMNLSKSL